MDKERFIKLCELNEWKEYVSFLKDFRNQLLEKIATEDSEEMFEKKFTAFNLLQRDVKLVDTLLWSFDEMYEKINLEYRLEKAREATKGKV